MRRRLAAVPAAALAAHPTEAGPDVDAGLGLSWILATSFERDAGND